MAYLHKRTINQREDWTSNDYKKSDDDGCTPPRKKRRYDVLRIISTSKSGSSVPLMMKSEDEDEDDDDDDEGSSSWNFNLVTHTDLEEQEFIKQFYITPTYIKLLGLILLGNEAKKKDKTRLNDDHCGYRFILGTKGVGKSCCLTFICSMLLQLMDDEPKTVEELIQNRIQTASTNTSFKIDATGDGGNGNNNVKKMNMNTNTQQRSDANENIGATPTPTPEEEAKAGADADADADASLTINTTNDDSNKNRTSSVTMATKQEADKKESTIQTTISSTATRPVDVSNNGNWKVPEYAAAYGKQQKKVNKILVVSCTDKFYEYFQRTNNDGRYRSEMGEYSGNVEDLARELDFEFAVTSDRKKAAKSLHNWLLLDPQSEHKPLGQKWQSNVVIATSMDEDTRIEGIPSTSFPRRYYLGPYSKEEYKQLIKKNTDDDSTVDDNMERSWKMYGGIPRHYFREEYTDARCERVKKELKELLNHNNGFELVDKMDLFGKTASSRNERHPTENTGLKLLNTVVHMIPDTSLTAFRLKVVNPLWLQFLQTEFKKVEYTRHKKAIHILYEGSQHHNFHNKE